MDVDDDDDDDDDYGDDNDNETLASVEDALLLCARTCEYLQQSTENVFCVVCQSERGTASSGTSAAATLHQAVGIGKSQKLLVVHPATRQWGRPESFACLGRMCPQTA